MRKVGKKDKRGREEGRIRGEAGQREKRRRGRGMGRYSVTILTKRN